MSTVHLLDGTYELFRQHYGRPPEERRPGEPVGVRGVIASVVGLLESGVTHLGVATDRVIESFRNRMWPGYKSSAGMDPEILGQFGLLDESLAALGVRLWSMVEHEADDALAAAAALAADDPEVDRVLILTPDKDLAQCVRGTRVVQVDRRRDLVTDEEGVHARYGVAPASIPDWLALVGDSADGFPGLVGWGKQTASRVLARYGHLEAIPPSGNWDVAVRSKPALAATLADNRELALLFRDLATLRTDRSLLEDTSSTEDLRWRGPGPGFDLLAGGLGVARLAERVAALPR